MAGKTGQTKWREKLTPRQLIQISTVFEKTWRKIDRYRTTYRTQMDNEAVFSLEAHDPVKVWKEHQKAAEYIAMAAMQGKLGKYDKFNDELKEVEGVPQSSWNYRIDHKSLAPIGQKLSAMTLALQAEGQKRYEGGPSSPRVGTVYSDKERTKIISELQRLKLAQKALSDHYEGGALSPAKISDLIDKLPKNSQGQYILKKSEDVTPIKDGKVWKLQVMKKEDHTEKSRIERLIGVKANQELHKGIPDENPEVRAIQSEADNLSTMLKNKGLNIVGSKDLYSIYRKGFFALFGGKGNFKRYQAGKSIKLSTAKKENFRKARTKLRKIAIEAGYAKAAWTNAARTHRPKKETEHGNIAKGLIAIRNKVNRQLPAEIRRNMGRPALINRTGRFSNSAVLAQLKPTLSGKTIKAEYTYMLNPYQTFENTGMRKWPMGYNPKPLISRSIRNLAEPQTREKFGIGITTRRI